MDPRSPITIHVPSAVEGKPAQALKHCWTTLARLHLSGMSAGMSKADAKRGTGP